MNREQAISLIGALYPADSEYQDSREIGKRLLQQAKDELNNWRNEPTEVLIRYAELCEREDNMATRELLRETR